MGEYAKYRGQQIKIGTCENMYYLRHDQRHEVTPESGSVNPAGRERFALRFRFPWPDEDHIKPGAFDGAFERTLAVPGMAVPDAVKHETLHFSSQGNGYGVTLPCPESAEYTKGTQGAWRVLIGVKRNEEIRVHQHGGAAGVLLAYQKPVEGLGLAPILMCGACRAMWREEDRAEIERIAVLFRSEADRLDKLYRREQDAPDARIRMYHTIADRILAGLDPIDTDPETGDKQPRLPDDVGQVRDQEHTQPPVADVPEGFSLRPPAETEPTQTNLLRFVGRS